MESCVKSILWCVVYGLLLAAASAPAFADTDIPVKSATTGTLLSDNKGSYEVIAGDRHLGEVDVYVTEFGNFVPLDSLLLKLKYPLYRDDANHLEQITFADGSTLTLDFTKKTYTRRGNTNSLGSNDYVISGPYIYLNTDFMNRVFPIGFSLDQALRKLRIENMETPPALLNKIEAPVAPPAPLRGQPPIGKSATHPSSGAQAPAPHPSTPNDLLYAPVPLPAPRMAVDIDEYTSRGMTEVPQASASRQSYYLSPGQAARSLPFTPLPPGAVPAAPSLVPPSSAGAVPPEAPPSGPLQIPPVPQAATSAPQTLLSPEEASIPTLGPSDENALILQPQIKKLPVTDQFIEAVELGDKIYLPLDEMMNLLEFDIKCDTGGGRAEGEFLAPPRAFLLDIDKGTLEIDHRSVPLAKDEAIRYKGILYVSTDAFEKWFTFKANVLRTQMVLKLDSLTILPLEARIARHNLWEKLLAANNAKNSNDMILVQNPYQLFALPSVDVNLSSSVQKGTTGGESFSNNYAILSGGDLGYMTTNFFATGSTDKPVDNLRLTMGRKDPDAELLGGLHATNFSFGDIESPSLANITSDPNGRGVLLTNRALNSSDTFDTHTFTGNAVPGWEVELYQNQTLVTFQTVGADGRYAFIDVPLLYGTNDFRIVLYGPQGQTEERVESILVGSSMLKKNQLEYTFSANQKDLDALDSLSKPQIPDTASSDIRAVSELRYGITKWLTAGTALTQTTVPEEAGLNVEHRYASSTLDTAVGNAFFDLTAVRDIAGGWMGGATALTSIDDISFRLRDRQFNNFVSETENPPTGQHRSDAELDANGQFYMPVIQDYTMGWKVERETFVTEVPKLTYTSIFSKSIWGTSFSNTLSYVQAATTETLGTTGWQARIGRVLVRADAQYEALPEIQFQDASLTTQYRIDKDVTAQTKIDKEITTDKTVTLSQSVNWDFKSFRFSINGNVDDKKEALIGFSLVFSFAHDPMHNQWNMQRQGAAQSGSIATRIFQDDNFNGEYTDGESLVDEAKPRINHLPLPDNKEGSFISPVTPYEPLDITVDPDSLKDPMLSPGSAGYRVMTRPGDVVTLNLPVISTSELDGEIAIEDEKGARTPLNDIVVELLAKDGAVVKRVVSESDGYFIFQKVRPGDYTLSVPAEALSEYDATLESPVPVTISKTSDFYTGNTLLLHTKTYSPQKHHYKVVHGP